jgi:hypothetical protein
MKTALLWLSLAAAAPAADYQISGIIVDHLTNRPLNHVLVQIAKVGKHGGDASVLTEADGRFSFTHVPLGKYQLGAEKRGGMPEGFHADGGYSTAIVVDGKEKTDGIVFAMRTDASISGTVLSDEGEPVANAEIDLFQETVSDGEAQVAQLRGGRTNSSGQFHMGHLEAGNYYVSVEAVPWFVTPGTATNLVYPVTFYGDVTEADSATVISLPEGGSASLQINMHTVAGIRVKLEDQTRSVGLFVPGPGGTRIPVMAVYNVGPATVRHRNGLVVAKGAEQQMELTNVAAGRYEVMIFGRQGGKDQSLETMDLADGSTITFDDVAPVVISGTVIFDGKRPGGDLEVYLNNPRQPGGMMSDVRPDGAFKAAHATSGKFQVNLNSPDLTITSVTAKGAQVVHDEVDVAAGATVELTIHAKASEALSNIDGVAVRDKAGVAGAMVLLLPQDLSQARLMRRDQADEDGSFSLAGVLPGRYTLVAIDEGNGLAYKTDAVIRPYLASGIALTIPLKGNDPVIVPVQARRR